MQTDAIDAGHPPKEPHLRFQFSDSARQFHAAKFGMWLFLGQEVMFFSALFCAYAYYRNQFPDAFFRGSQHLNTTFGLLETIDLLTSSLTVALAIHFIRQGKRGLTTAMLIITIVCAFIFLVMHGHEYATEYHEGLLPGRYFNPAAHLEGPALTMDSAMFFTVYFFLTVLHSIHVIIGIGVLSVILVFNMRGKYSQAYYTHVEVGGLYWHLVDLIWIFLFPLLYLVT
jgi:cytochrome c oxidase subunit III